MGLPINTHLGCCPANPIRLHTRMYALSLDLLTAYYLGIYEQPRNVRLAATTRHCGYINLINVYG